MARKKSGLPKAGLLAAALLGGAALLASWHFHNMGKESVPGPESAAPHGNQAFIQNAVNVYFGENNGRWPETLGALVPGYLQSIPENEVSASRKVVRSYDGTGGWV